jgi:hypothetical protein
MKTSLIRDAQTRVGKGEVWQDPEDKILGEKTGTTFGLSAATHEPNHGGVPMPDFAARRATIWGDRVFSAAEVRAMREAELEGDDG